MPSFSVYFPDFHVWCRLRYRHFTKRCRPKISVRGFVCLHVAGSLVPVSYQSSKNGCDVHREDNASTVINAYNNTSALLYTFLHYVRHAAPLPALWWEREFKRWYARICGLQITLCRRFQTTTFCGRIPAANVSLLTYATPTLAPGTVS